MSDLTLVPGPTFDHKAQDLNDPKALINLVPKSVKDAMLRVPEAFLNMDERELEKLTPKQSFTLVDRRLRTAFWLEYARATDAGTALNLANVYQGVCSRAYFYNYVIESQPRLAYLLLAPTDYRIAMEEALLFGVDRLREILDLPIYDPSGKPDPKIADVILKTVAILDQRVKGAVIQKIQQHTVHESKGGGKPTESPETMVEIEAKLASLRAQAGTIEVPVISSVVEDETD